MSRGEATPWLYRWSLALRGPLLSLWRVRADGIEHVPREGPALIVSNHESFIDPWILCAALPRRPIRFLINQPWYERSRVWTAVFDGYGAIPAASADPRETLRRVADALGSGAVVGMFPEGSVARADSMRPFQPGIALIAAHTGIPVVPCGIVGTREAAPYPRKVPLPHPLSLAVAPVSRFPGAPVAEPSATAVLAFTSEIETTVRALVSRLETERAARSK